MLSPCFLQILQLPTPPNPKTFPRLPECPAMGCHTTPGYSLPCVRDRLSSHMTLRSTSGSK